MHKLESVLENDTHKILCDLEIETDNVIPARTTEPAIVAKKQ